jgi:ribonuclease HI
VSNDLAKVYALWCGLNLAKKKGIERLLVIGDSLLVIQAVIGPGSPSSNKIISLLKSIKRLAQSFKQICFFHIKRGLNAKADSWAKKAKSL